MTALARRVTTFVMIFALALALLALGATSRIGRLATPLPRRSVDVGTAPQQVVPTHSQTPVVPILPRSQTHHAAPPWVLQLVLVLAAVAVLVVIWLIVRRVFGRLAERRALTRAHGGAAPAQEAEPLPEFVAEVVESFHQTLARLMAGDSTDEAILECWRRLEDAAAATGVPREPTRTATEFTVDLLRATPARPDDLRTLADLYRQAMFSTIPVSDADRRRAVAALGRLAADLGSTRPADARGDAS